MLLERAVFKMYIMDSCPYCDKARDIILNEERASLHTINISSDHRGYRTEDAPGYLYRERVHWRL